MPMSRTYRPRLSKDKAIAQRVGKELERETLQEHSVARQIAALKVLDETTDASGTGPSEGDVPVRTSTASSSTRSSKRKRAASTACVQTDESISVENHDEARKSTSATESSMTLPTAAEPGERWGCLSCTLLNSAKAVKCRVCGTKHFKQLVQNSSQESQTKGTPSRGRGVSVEEPRKGNRDRRARLNRGKGASNACRDRQDSGGCDGGEERPGSDAGASTASTGTQHQGAPATCEGPSRTRRTEAKDKKRSEKGPAANRTIDDASKVIPTPENMSRRRVHKRGRDKSRETKSPLLVNPPRPPQGVELAQLEGAEPNAKVDTTPKPVLRARLMETTQCSSGQAPAALASVVVDLSESPRAESRSPDAKKGANQTECPEKRHGSRVRGLESKPSNAQARKDEEVPRTADGHGKEEAKTSSPTGNRAGVSKSSEGIAGCQKERKQRASPIAPHVRHKTQLEKSDKRATGGAPATPASGAKASRVMQTAQCPDDPASATPASLAAESVESPATKSRSPNPKEHVNQVRCSGKNHSPEVLREEPAWKSSHARASEDEQTPRASSRHAEAEAKARALTENRREIGESAETIMKDQIERKLRSLHVAPQSLHDGREKSPKQSSGTPPATPISDKERSERGLGSPENEPWLMISRAARLDFAGRGSMWDVSSVVVSPSYPCSARDERQRGKVVVCHSGGVSVWCLTKTATVCTHISPALAGAQREKLRVSLDTAAVVDGGYARENSASSVAESEIEMCIVAVGRHTIDPGPPVIRVWHGPRSDPEAGDSDREATNSRAPGTPEVLTVTLKRRFQGFFPPVAPREVEVRLCVCGYSQTPRVGERLHGEITAVMALGVKAVRLVFAPSKVGNEEIKAKALPSASSTDTAVFTSLARVESNPFLVWASAPSVNVVLLWNVRDLQILFTLPLSCSDICIPAIRLPPWEPDNGASGGVPASPARSEVSLTSAHGTATMKRRGRLLCLLAASMSDSACSDGVSCTLFGVCGGIAGDDTGPQSCAVSVLTLGTHSSPVGETPKRDHGDELSGLRSWRSLADAGGLVLGIGERGTIMARSLLTGDSRVLVEHDPADDGGPLALDCNRNVGILVVVVGQRGGADAAATTVDLYVLRDVTMEASREAELVPR